MGKVLSFKPRVGNVQMSQTISEFTVIFPKNKLDQKMVDNHRPKTLKSNKPKRQVYETSILKHGQSECT